MPGFEGTFLGDSSKLHPDTRLECKVCHYIYDPAKGDVDQNIEPALLSRNCPSIGIVRFAAANATFLWLCPKTMIKTNAPTTQNPQSEEPWAPNPAQRLERGFNRIWQTRMHGPADVAPAASMCRRSVSISGNTSGSESLSRLGA